MMKAVVISDFGDISMLHDAVVECPTPAAHQILVKVVAAATNPVDTKIRKGYMAPRMLPAILGYDVSGIVQQLGPDVSQFQVGDEVYGCPALSGQGAYAEYCLLDARRTSIPIELAAAVPLVALTAWEALVQKARIAAGQTVLIQAGAGGVGHIAIQIAKLHGCRVFATAGNPTSIAFCREMGADEVINYKSENVPMRARAVTDGLGVDVAMDNVGSTFESSVRSVRPHGAVITIAGGDVSQIRGEMARSSLSWHMEFVDSYLVTGVDPSPQGAILRTVAGLIDAGRLQVHVSHTFAMDAAGVRDAHALQESGTTIGKILLRR